MNDNDGKYLSQIQSNSFKNKLLHQIHNILCQALPWTLRKQELHEPGSPSIHNTICLLYKKKVKTTNYLPNSDKPNLPLFVTK